MIHVQPIEAFAIVAALAVSVCLIAAVVYGVKFHALQALVNAGVDDGLAAQKAASEVIKAAVAREAEVEARSAELEAFQRRSPLVLKMDKVAGHKLLDLVDKVPDDAMQYAAVGLALYAARGNEALQAVALEKLAYLEGRLSQGAMEQLLAEAFQSSTFDEETGETMKLSRQQQATFAGCGMSGHTAFACALNHVTEVAQ